MTNAYWTDWQGIREFGVRAEGFPLRPSAYGLIRDSEGRVAIVRASDGIFLPGGGIEDGETPEQAVTREAIEECGWRVRVGACVCRAIQFTTKTKNLSWFFEIEIEEHLSVGVEEGHETLWIPPENVDAYLRQESHVWAVQDWVSRNR